MRRVSLIFWLLTTVFIRMDANPPEEGMWIPMLLQSLNEGDLKARGLKLSAEEIYSVNHASMKDAVFSFGGFCSSSVISDKGLLLTNFHCASPFLPVLSSPENNLRENGFWALNRGQEIPVEGLSATRLVRMEDVTEQVLANVTDQMRPAEKAREIEKAIAQIESETARDSVLKAEVKSFFFDTQFYLILTETFPDIRLVGVPPQQIGNFGGETDNWLWPRQTGDFALFRIYADDQGKPAPYSAGNQPLHPEYYFSISTQGYQEGDFTMVYGFPGETHEYLTSFALDQLKTQTLPHRIRVTEKLLGTLRTRIHAQPELREKYAILLENLKNHLKKWQAELEGLNSSHAVEARKKRESKFQYWADEVEERRLKYGYLLRKIEQLYQKRVHTQKYVDYMHEGVFQTGIMRFAYEFQDLANVNEEINEWELAMRIEGLKRQAKEFFRNFDAETDRMMLERMLVAFSGAVPEILHPREFRESVGKGRGKIAQYCEKMFRKSFLVSESKTQKFLDRFKPKQAQKIKKDPGFRLMMGFVEQYHDKILPKLHRLDDEIFAQNQEFVRLLRQMEPEKKFYPDANGTLRLSYGEIAAASTGSQGWMTTLDQLVARHQPGVPEFGLPEKLIQLHQNKDFGDYAVNGTVPVCFLATNHTSGGNSGSPVLDGNGYLIGTNFDRNWEAAISDYYYDPASARNISVDIRYILFIIDKYAGANHLIREMTLIK